MKRSMNGFAFMTLLILAFGCNSSKNMTNKEAALLLSNEWKLNNVGGLAIPQSSDAALIFQADQKVFGSTGCNRLNGTFETKSKKGLQFSPLATTRMSCMDGNQGDIERKFLDALARTTSWKISDGFLSLMDDKTTLATLIANTNSGSNATGLSGDWELNYITGPKITFDGLYPDKKPTISFNLADSSASGNSSCNSYSVPVEIDGHKISFGEGLATLMACEGEGETVYLQTLRKVKTYKVSEDNKTLELIMDGIPMMRFTRK